MFRDEWPGSGCQRSSRSPVVGAKGACTCCLAATLRRGGRASLQVTPRLSLSPKRARHATAGKLGGHRQAHWALMLYSVPDFTFYVKPKSGPEGEKNQLVRRAPGRNSE